jgi:hypothetical protein
VRWIDTLDARVIGLSPVIGVLSDRSDEIVEATNDGGIPPDEGCGVAGEGVLPETPVRKGVRYADRDGTLWGYVGYHLRWEKEVDALKTLNGVDGDGGEVNRLESEQLLGRRKDIWSYDDDGEMTGVLDGLC